MLLKKAYRPMWVKSNAITDVAGWRAEKMRQARDNGYVQFEIRKKDDHNEYWYELNSIHERFLKPQ